MLATQVVQVVNNTCVCDSLLSLITDASTGDPVVPIEVNPQSIDRDITHRIDNNKLSGYKLLL